MSRRSRRRWSQGYVSDGYPLEPLGPTEAQGAPRISAEEVQQIPPDNLRPRPFEYRPTAPADNTGVAGPNGTRTVWLIGDSSNPGVVQAAPIPARCHGFVDFISPYVDAACLPSHSGLPLQFVNLPPLIAGDVVWNFYVDGRPAGDYANITNLLQSWLSLADRPMIQLAAGQILTCSVLYKNQGGLEFTNVGVRVKGWIVPFESVEPEGSTP